jgi:L-fucose isomerase-like protein
MDKFKATNRDLLNLYKGLEAVKSMKGARFAVLVGKNIKELRNVLDPLEQAAVPGMEFQELSIEMQKLIEAEDQEAITKLEEDNTELIEQRKKQLADVEELLDNEIEVFLHPIREDQLPEEITGEQVERLLQIIA